MTVPVPSNETSGLNVSTPENSGVEYGRSADGLLVARIGDLVFAMVPGRQGFFLASAWRVGKPFADMKRDDFYSHHGAVEGEAAFHARMTEQAGHSRELKLLDRKTMRIPAHTPWGASQHAETSADGIVRHGTSRHGGFHLSPDRNAKVHPMLRTEDGFYEEDAAWAIVAITFPDLFTSYERRCAEGSIKDWWPDAWEAITGISIGPGESHVRNRKAFEMAHAGDWIVISALRSDHRPGMTEVIATRGGRRDLHVEERRFLVPSSEYEVGRFGFVIDETRHAAYDGPSSFATWPGRRSS